LVGIFSLKNTLFLRVIVPDKPQNKKTSKNQKCVLREKERNKTCLLQNNHNPKKKQCWLGLLCLFYV